jgi:hypothetical protein
VSAVAMVISAVTLLNFTAFGRQQIQSITAKSSGIYREVTVYSMSGDVIESFTGKFNIEYSDNRVEFFNADTNKRINIYYKTGTVIVKDIDV